MHNKNMTKERWDAKLNKNGLKFRIHTMMPNLNEWHKIKYTKISFPDGCAYHVTCA